MAKWRHDVAFDIPTAGAIVDPRHAGRAGGAEAQIMMVATGLASRGLRVALVVAGERSKLPTTIDGVRLIVHDHAPEAGETKRRGALARRASALLSARAAVLVHRGAGAAIAVTRAAAWLGGSRFVYSSANVVDFDFSRLERSHLRLRAYESSVRAAHAIVVQTEEQIELCRLRFRRTPILIPSIAQPQALRVRRPEAFLWVGRAAPYKRPDRFLELARRVPEARFRMVLVPSPSGGDVESSRAETEARDLPNLEILPPRSREEIGALIERSVAVVNTSDYEGLSNVFLEAWSRGVPGLALTHDPDGLIVAEGLGGFAGGSQARLAEIARDMWNHREDQRDVAQRARRYVARRHSPERVTDAWSQVLTRLG